MNRRDKMNLVKRLSEQYHRGTDEGDQHDKGADYVDGWRSAVRSCASAAGVYDEFCKSVDAVKGQPQEVESVG